MIPLQGRYPINEDTVEPEPGRIPSPPKKRLLIRGHHLVNASTLVGAIFVLAWLAVGFGGPAVTSLGSAIVDRTRPPGSQATAGVGAATTQGGRGGVAGGSSPSPSVSAPAEPRTPPAGDGRPAAAVPSAAPASTPTTGAWPAPVVDPGPFGTVQLGGLYTESGTVSSGAPGPMTGTVNYGDGSGDQPLPVQNGAFGLSHLFRAVGTYTVIVQVTDSRAGVGTGYTIVTVSLPQGPPLP